jgi:ATP synthase in type III secretion protein N
VSSSNFDFEFDFKEPNLEAVLGSEGAEVVARSGRVSTVKGLIVIASVPDVRLGEVCRIKREGVDLLGEVIGFDDRGAILMPYDRLDAVAMGAVVEPVEAMPTVPCAETVRGRVLNAMGEPLDGKGPLAGNRRTPLYSKAPDSLRRKPNDEPLETGIRAIDGLLTVAIGQRVGLCAAAGVGKSTLLSCLVRNVKADTIVLALIGERGREVRQFIEHDLGPEGVARATVIVSTSDESALMHIRAAYAATAIAEEARSRGERVLLMMDSVTRFARALRDLGQAVGEPMGKGGYPASMYARLPQLFERAGNAEVGSITAFYTVLADSDDVSDPVVEETISLLDGHFLLSREIAASGRYPAIDVLRSKSRLMSLVTSREHRALASKVLRLKSEFVKNYDKIKMGLYEDHGMDSAEISARDKAIEAFLHQDTAETQPIAQTIADLNDQFGDWYA